MTDDPRTWSEAGRESLATALRKAVDDATAKRAAVATLPSCPWCGLAQALIDVELEVWGEHACTKARPS
jgi:hypothetical protein